MGVPHLCWHGPGGGLGDREARGRSGRAFPTHFLKPQEPVPPWPSPVGVVSPGVNQPCHLPADRPGRLLLPPAASLLLPSEGHGFSAKSPQGRVSWAPEVMGLGSSPHVASGTLGSTKKAQNLLPQRPSHGSSRSAAGCHSAARTSPGDPAAGRGVPVPAPPRQDRI